MKSLLNDRRFISMRNFCYEQAPSSEVICNDASTLSIVQQIPQETKHRDVISCSTSYSSSQAQECNLPDVLVGRVENDHSSKQVELFVVELEMQNSQFPPFMNI